MESFLQIYNRTHEHKSLATGSLELVFYKIGALKNFAKFTGKHLCQILFLIKDLEYRPATLLTQKLWHRCFFREIFKNICIVGDLQMAASENGSMKSNNKGRRFAKKKVCTEELSFC